MPTFVNLTSIYRDQPVWVNLDQVREMKREPAREASTYSAEAPDRTVIWFDGSGPNLDDWDRTEVLEPPDEILFRATPEVS